MGRVMAIKGLDAFSKKIKKIEKELEDVASALDGDLATVSFDPNDPQSIELAIQRIEADIDDRVGSSDSSGIVSNIVAQLKDQARQAILDRAENARLGGGVENDD